MERVYQEFRHRQRLGFFLSEYPLVSFSSEEFLRAAMFVLTMTAIYLPLFAFASYWGVLLMDLVKF
jgi:hypothetical protein